MKEKAREILEDIFYDWCSAIEMHNSDLIKMYYNRFMGALEVYSETFSEDVSYRAKKRYIAYMPKVQAER